MTSERRTGLPLKSGDEQDGLTAWKRMLNWRPGERAAIKRGYNRRVRKQAVDLSDD